VIDVLAILIVVVVFSVLIEVEILCRARPKQPSKPRIKARGSRSFLR